MPDAPPPDAPPPDTQSRPPSWHAPLVLAVVLIAVVVSQTLLRRQPEADGNNADDSGAKEAESATVDPTTVVTLSIVAAEESPPTETQTAWRDRMTALDLLESHEPPTAVEKRGAGVDAFVTAIGGVANEGPGGRNWQYSVNGERAAVGAGSRVLEPGDRVLWEFAPYE